MPQRSSKSGKVTTWVATSGKKRLNRNLYGAIALTVPRRFWLFAYLYAKKDRENIDWDELAAFKKLAKSMANADDAQLAQLAKSREIVEICR